MLTAKHGKNEMVDFFGWSVWNRSNPKKGEHHNSDVRLVPVTKVEQEKYLKRMEDEAAQRKYYPIAGITSSRKEK